MIFVHLEIYSLKHVKIVSILLSCRNYIFKSSFSPVSGQWLQNSSSRKLHLPVWSAEPERLDHKCVILFVSVIFISTLAPLVAACEVGFENSNLKNSFVSLHNLFPFKTIPNSKAIKKKQYKCSLQFVLTGKNNKQHYAIHFLDVESNCFCFVSHIHSHKNFMSARIMMERVKRSVCNDRSIHEHRIHSRHEAIFESFKSRVYLEN